MSPHPWSSSTSAYHHLRQTSDADASAIAGGDSRLLVDGNLTSADALFSGGGPITNMYSAFYGTELAGLAPAADPAAASMQPAALDGYYALHNSVFTTQPAATGYSLETDYLPSVQWDRIPASEYATNARQRPPPRIKRRASEGANMTQARAGSAPGTRPMVKRSRMGCLTCRLRRKRCCETRPWCTECSRLGLLCVWPKPGTEYKNRPKDQKEDEKTINHEVYGKIKVLRGIIEHKAQ